MIFTPKPDGTCEVQAYSYAKSVDETVGCLKQVPKDDNYWYFFPNCGCALTAGDCRDIRKKLGELNALNTASLVK